MSTTATRTMTPRRILAIGWRRGLTELVHMARNRQEVLGYLITPLVFVLVGLTIDRDIPGTGVPAVQMLFAGGASFLVFQIGLINLPQVLVTEREDGTLLRLRALPGGIGAYLVGKALYIGGLALASVALMLGTGRLFAGVPLPSTLQDWLTLGWVLVLGLAAVVPLGAALGAVLPNAREALGLLMIPVMGLLFISGVMFPATAFPEVVQQIGAVFPLKWMSLGVRSAMLPDAMLAAEPGGSWQHPVVAAVLAAWTVGGMLLAPPLLRRMTRRQSGSRLQADRGQLASRVA